MVNRRNKIQLFVISDYETKQDVKIFDAILLNYDMYYGIRSTLYYATKMYVKVVLRSK